MSFTTHQGGEGGVTITGGMYVTVSAGATASGTVSGASATALCVSNWTGNEERNHVSVMTTCDFDTLFKTTYQNDSEVSRGFTFDIEAFSIDEVPEAPLVEATVIGPIELKKYVNGVSGKKESFIIPLAVITAVPHGGAAAGEDIHRFKFSGKAKGKFYRNVT